MNKPDARKGNADSDDAPIDLDERPAPASLTADAPGPVRAGREDDGLDDIQTDFSTPYHDEAWTGWNGRSSKVRLARGLLRDQSIIGPQSECIDCLKTGRHTREHQFHIKASKVGREWFGPEAEHYMDLLRDGLIYGTRQASEHEARQNLVDGIRGIFPSDVCATCGVPIDRKEDGGYRPMCANGHRNGLPELAALSTEQLQRMWRRDLAGGAHEATRRERQLAHADITDLQTQQLAMINVMRLGMGLEPLSELPQFAGAAAPGARKATN